jgi:hypothetical protein
VAGITGVSTGALLDSFCLGVLSCALSRWERLLCAPETFFFLFCGVSQLSLPRVLEQTLDLNLCTMLGLLSLWGLLEVDKMHVVRRAGSEPLGEQGGYGCDCELCPTGSCTEPRVLCR